MKLNAMRGRKSIGYVWTIPEPSQRETQCNIEGNDTTKHGMRQEGRKPYPIPARELRMSAKRHDED